MNNNVSTTKQLSVTAITWDSSTFNSFFSGEQALVGSVLFLNLFRNRTFGIFYEPETLPVTQSTEEHTKRWSSQWPLAYLVKAHCYHTLYLFAIGR